MRRRDIAVFDRAIPAPADASPPPELRIVGDPRDTLPQAWERWPREAAFVHFNLPAATRLAAELAPLVAPMLRPDAVVVSEMPIELPGWEAIPPPDAARDRGDYLYRVL